MEALDQEGCWAKTLQSRCAFEFVSFGNNCLGKAPLDWARKDYLLPGFQKQGMIMNYLSNVKLKIERFIFIQMIKINLNYEIPGSVSYLGQEELAVKKNKHCCASSRLFTTKWSVSSWLILPRHNTGVSEMTVFVIRANLADKRCGLESDDGLSYSRRCLFLKDLWLVEKQKVILSKNLSKIF